MLLDVGGCRKPRDRDLVVEGYHGEALGARDLAWIQKQVREQHRLTRRELAVAACKHFGWRRPGGSYAIESVRLLLVRWEKRGLLQLPPPTRGRPAPRRIPDEADGEEFSVGTDGRLEVRPITEGERPRWRSLMRRHHYLGDGGDVGETIRYVALEGGKPAALLSWSAAALYNGPRDEYLGWDSATRKRRLHLVANNVRFLVLPGARRPHLASKVLGANLRRLSRDWQAVYGHPLFLVETFVDVSRFQGTCYRASNWIEVGRTRGFTRMGPKWLPNGQPKAVFLYPLHRHARERLVAVEEERVKKQESATRLDPSALPLSGEGGLYEVFEQIPECRKARGVRFKLPTILAVAACAVLAGQKSVAAIAQWAREQDPEILRHLGCRRGQAPSETTLRRVFRVLDIADFDRRVGAWFAKQQTLAGQGLAMDGKTVRGSANGDTPAAHLVSVVSHDERTVVAQEQVASKTNEIKTVKPILDPMSIEGAVITGDAMFAQKEIARYIVEEKKAHYVFIVKDNQPTLLDDIDSLHLEAFPPGDDDAG
jgi:hypothetical protein